MARSKINGRITELLERGISGPAGDGLAKLGKVVRKVYGTNESTDGYAEVVAVCSVPSYTLRDEQGTTYSWRQDLTRPASLEEELAYWKARAQAAERRVEDVNQR
jgi:hypothetical protein